MSHKTIGVSLPKSTAEEVERRAKAMTLTPSMYLRVLIEKHVESGIKLILEG